MVAVVANGLSTSYVIKGSGIWFSPGVVFFLRQCVLKTGATQPIFLICCTAWGWSSYCAQNLKKSRNIDTSWQTRYFSTISKYFFAHDRSILSLWCWWAASKDNYLYFRVRWHLPFLNSYPTRIKAIRKSKDWTQVSTSNRSNNETMDHRAANECLPWEPKSFCRIRTSWDRRPAWTWTPVSGRSARFACRESSRRNTETENEAQR